jgi:hypothetical protein
LVPVYDEKLTHVVSSVPGLHYSPNFGGGGCHSLWAKQTLCKENIYKAMTKDKAGRDMTSGKKLKAIARLLLSNLWALASNNPQNFPNLASSADSF